MAYPKQTWADGPEGGTPITAARLGVIETGIDEAHTAIDTLTTTVENIPAAAPREVLTQAEFDALSPTDGDTLYVIVG